MNRSVSLVLAFLAAAASASAAPLANRLVIPAAAHAAGAGGSAWATDLDLYNAGAADVVGTVRFVADGTTGSDASPTATITIPARGSFPLRDAVQALFSLDSASGALSFEFGDADLPKVAVGSRTYNQASTGTFGQSIPALDAGSALAAGSTGVLFAPRDPAVARVNLGLYALEASVVNWHLVEADGTVSAERLGVSYAASAAVRYNDGVRSFLGATPTAGQVVQVEVVSGKVLPWASRIDNATNDGDFATARGVRANEPPIVQGLDTNHDGSPDILDADGNATLDLALGIPMSGPFPFDVQLIAADPEGRQLTFTGISLPNAVKLDAATGRMTIYPSFFPGTVPASIRVKVSDGTADLVVTIPLSGY